MPVLISNVYTQYLHLYFKMFYIFLKYILKYFYISSISPKSRANLHHAGNLENAGNSMPKLTTDQSNANFPAKEYIKMAHEK